LAGTPGYVADSSNFSLEIYKDEGFNFKIASLADGIFISADELVAGSMTLVSYVPKDYTVQSYSLHTASFIMKNPISEDGKIYIFTPTETNMQVTENTSVIVTSTQISTSYSAVVKQEAATGDWYIEIDNIFGGTDVPNSSTEVSIAFLSEGNLQFQGMQNPTSVKDAGAWRITTYTKVDDVFYIVDTATSTTSFVAEAGGITKTSNIVTSS